VVAALESLSKGEIIESSIDSAPSWRFSGRWFNAGRYALRRPYRIN
jgi:hypothetical protein